MARALHITSLIAVVMTLGGLASLVGCGEDTADSGLDQALRVRDAVLKEGVLPGLPVDEQPDGGAAEDLEGARITYVSTMNRVVHPGQAEFPVNGRTTPDAYSIGVRLSGSSSGYWIKPVAGEDVNAPGELSWSLSLGFARGVPAGTHQLEIVAFDARGVPGPQTTLELCITRDFEGSLNACDATVKPPAAVIALRWNVDADVDLVVKTPSGEFIDATHSATFVSEDGDVDATAPGVGILQADSNPSCDLDGKRIETLTFQTSPERGTYQVYANLFEACGRASVQLEATAYARTRSENRGSSRAEDEPDGFGITTIGEPVSAVLLSGSANGGASHGLYLTSYEFP